MRAFTRILLLLTGAALRASGINATFPGDASYASASTAFNLRFTLKPAAITFPKSAEEVAEVVKIGAAQKVPVVARSGGHSYIANGLGGKDGALVVDLRNLDSITIDSSSGTAVIETGNRLGDIALALGNAGRALPHGICPYVGIGGHASHGGFGFTSRMWGLTLDTITALTTVLANGTLIRVTNSTHPDLFWALRGSASSFGITTSLEVRTFPSPPTATIFRYDWDLPNAPATARALTSFQSFARTADLPPHFGALINIARGPPPSAGPGSVTLSLVGGWYAPVSGLNATLHPFLREMPEPQRTTLDTGTYLHSAAVLVGSLDTKSAPDGHDTFYAKSVVTPAGASPIPAGAVLAFARYLTEEGWASETEWFVQLELYGGKNSAINAVPPDATSFAHRSSLFTIQFYAAAPGRVPPYPQDGFAFMDDMVKTLTELEHAPADWQYGAYLNYIDDRLVDWKERYYGAHYARLRELKDEYDPRDVFSFPMAVEE
ncbi:putative oxygen-dependent FAD-linked oxidoreductase family protein [Lyophyllum shimeji]|uniref:Oxygen-dependent FAD-linked oxidoreductase family protein n=1 Tax=Lyophyllum shimeji TaxID=47721 RepID=A0A9P3PWH1_LYOSH|nr:putative oxygen-dependent FAD-linked oxidoreductase family protein [Lyophyllum shimeji]